MAAPPTRQLVADGLVALALAALSAALLQTLNDLPLAAWLLALAHVAPLAFRRRAPVPAAVVGLAAALAYALAGYPMVGLGPAGLVWLYSIGSEVARPLSLGLLAVSLAALATMVVGGDQGDTGTLVGDAIALTVAFLLGDSARRRRELLALHRDRADQAERAQAEVARRAVAEERLRIARELHDVVAHSMSVIAVQAGTGRLVIDRDPGQARQALAVIEETSRQALEEMRRLLGVLRAGDAGGERAPAPSLDGLDELVARTAAGGVPVSVRVEGDRRPLPPGLELAAYRIVQEALTNVARHAPGAEATVTIAYGDGALTVEVANSPPRSAPPAGDGAEPGHGLVGMRERAAVYGGAVEAAPQPGGGFRVRAVLHTGDRA